MLAAPAAAGWTPRDLNQLVSDWLGVGRRIPDSPARPIGLLGAILAWHGADNLADRPAALDEAREAAARAQAQARRAAQADSRRAHALARAAARAALSGPGRAEVAAVMSALRRRRGERRTAQIAADHARIEALVDEARSTDRRSPDATRGDLWR